MEPHLHPHPLWPVPHIPEPRICCLRATGQGGIPLPPRAGTCFHSPPSLRSPLSARWQEGRGFLLFVDLPPAASASQGGQSAAPPVDLSLTLPDAPQPLHFLFQLCHQSEQITYLLAPNTAVISAVFPYECQAQALPAAGKVEQFSQTRKCHLRDSGLIIMPMFLMSFNYIKKEKG